ncbi:MAG: tetratricopeptide repeat protein, partial [Planctomycetes bacterium]|nr:tetratricopeptide repeat protein [Planctomycetota bacterium]
AIAAYEQALAVGPGSSADATIYLSLAGLHRALGRLDRAARALEAADRAAPGHPEVLANLGTVHRELGRDGDALAAWRRFLEVAPPRHPLRARIEAAVRRLEQGR